MRARRRATGIVSLVSALLGLLLLVGGVLEFPYSRFEALFMVGTGSLLLGLGGVARLHLAAGVLTASGGLVMVVLAVFGFGVP
jgi:hypothetical protein